MSGCKRGQSKEKAKPRRFQCVECGAVARHKQELCAPTKTKKPRKGKS